MIPGTSPKLCLISDEYSPSLAVVNCDLAAPACGQVWLRGGGPAVPERLPDVPWAAGRWDERRDASPGKVARNPTLPPALPLCPPLSCR